MCRPIPGNFVRPKDNYKVLAMAGSSGVEEQSSVTLLRETKGMAEGPHDDDPDRFVILFEQRGALIRTTMHHTQLKGVEA